MPPDYLTVTEAATRLRISTAWLRRVAHNRGILVRMGPLYVLKASDFKALQKEWRDRPKPGRPKR